MDTLSSKPSICFIAHNAYGVLANVNTGHAGGVEVQIPLLAKWFSGQGYPVSMITWDENYQDGCEIEGITLYKLCKKDAGIRGIRFFTPRWSSLVSALRRADANIYYYSCGDLTLGQIAIWTHLNNRKLIHSIVNEADCKKSLVGLSASRERILYRHGLRNADATITQSHTQQQLLLADFGIESTIIPMPSNGFSGISNPIPQPRASSELRNVLWIGRFSREKRLEWLLETAKLLPDFHFDVIGAPNQDSDYAQELQSMAKQLNNVALHGRVAHENLGAFYRKASVLCSTSIYEGFPNVFLESWSVGLPLVTTFDPDNVVQRNHLGCIASSVAEVADCIRVCCMTEKWSKLHVATQEYFLNNHTTESCLPKYKAVVDSLYRNSQDVNPASQRIDHY